MKSFYADNNVKFITTPSHTPQPHVENMNNQVRKMMRVYFVKNHTTRWVDNLEKIESDLNYYNLEIKKPKAADNFNIT